MSLTSDEFDSEIRGVLYELRDRVDDNLSGDEQAKFLRSGIEAAIQQADDYRIELLDREDAEEELAMKRQEAADLGDAKLEEQRSER